MTYLPIIPMLLDKVTCLTSALFLLLSFFISFIFCFSVYFPEPVGGVVGGRVGGARWDSALYILIFFFQCEE